MSRGAQAGAAVDLRLVPAALLSWSVAVLGLAVGWVASGVAATLSVVLGGLLWGWSRRGPGARLAAGVVAAAGCVAATGLVVTAAGYQLAHHPLLGSARSGSAASVRVVLSGDPVPVLGNAGAGYGGRSAGASQVAAPARLVEASADGGRWTSGGRVLLLAPVAGWAELLPGTEVTASGLLAPATRADLTVAVLRVRGPPRVLAGAPWWQRGADTLRDGLRAAARSALSTDSAALLPGLAIGDTSRMSWTLREDFRTTGLTHLLAVSGANVVIICGTVLGLLTLLGAGRRTRVVVAVLALVGFVILARPSPSVLRAAVMGGIGLLALLAGRQRPVLPALAASVIALLLVDPALATDPGFALSVLATGALVLMAPGWAAGLRGLGVPPGAAEALAVPAAAHLVTAPVIAGLSGQVSLIAVAANLLAAPAVAPVTVLGVLAAVVSPVSSTLAGLCLRLASPAVGWLVWVGHRGAAVEGGALSWPSGLPGALLLAALTVCGLVLLRRRRVRVLALAALLGALLVLVPTRVIPPGWPAAGWAVVACDVGQGDAIVLATGRPGQAVLVDTGTEVGAVDGCLSRLGVHALSLVVLSHLHADHVGGLAAAMGGRSVGAVAVGPVHLPSWTFEQVRRTALGRGVPLVGLGAGQRLAWPALGLDVLGPAGTQGGLDPDDGTDVNNTSLVLRAVTSAGTVLLTGDAELLAQASLLTGGIDLRADVLKIPHHGSRYTSPAFLSAVHPRLALVSVGAGNSYGHPNAGLLDGVRSSGALVRRTDQSGDVAVLGSPGGPVAVSRGHPRPAPRKG
ncbi:MAG TPA: ComEC/Rec2 family competence protein [Pseudonocardia sp.]